MNCFEFKLDPLELGQEQIFENVGYTTEALKLLERSRGFLLPSGPKTLGGEKRVTPAMRQECRQLCQKWVRLVGETILAEFPSYDILGSFHVFNLDPKARRDASDCLVQDSAATALARLAKHCNVDPAALTAELEDHRPIALQLAAECRMDNFSAWKEAIARSQSRKTVRQNHPCQSLKEVLICYGALQSSSTSAVERLFSQVQNHVPHDRAHMLAQHLKSEVKLLAMEQGMASSMDLIDLARANWAANYGTPRRNHQPRLDKGVAKKRSAETEAAFLAKRRKAADVKELVPLEKVLEDAGGAVNPKELSLQKTRQYLHKAHAYLEEALLEGEVPEHLVEVAEALKTIQEANDKQRQAKASRQTRLFQPTKPSLRGKSIWLQKESWMVQAGGYKYVHEPRFASVFVVASPEIVPERIHWLVSIQGGSLVSPDFLSSHCSSGWAFEYQPATSVRRHIFIDPVSCFVGFQSAAFQIQICLIKCSWCKKLLNE